MDDRAGELTLSHQRSGREAYLCARGGLLPTNVHSTGHAADDDFALHHSSNADFSFLILYRRFAHYTATRISVI
jgi:hypothetical protein